MLTKENDKWGLLEPVSDRDELTGQIEELDSDIEGWKGDTKDLMKEVAELKYRIASAARKRAGLQAQLNALPPEDEDEDE